MLLCGCEFVQTHNKLATEKEAIKGDWSQVDADLQRRADLIPNLVETVKGYAKEETGVMEDLANARAAMIGAKTPLTRSAPTTNSMARWAGLWWWWKIIPT